MAEGQRSRALSLAKPGEGLAREDSLRISSYELHSLWFGNLFETERLKWLSA